MRKISLYLNMSLDGVISDQEKWMTMTDEIIEDSFKAYDTLDTVIFGSKTYPGLAEYWQKAEKSANSDIERRFAKRINDIQQYVISRSDVDLVWRNSQLLKVKDVESLAQEIDKLKNSEGKDISVESGLKIWQLFLENSLFDELQVVVHPAVADQGDKLFTGVGKIPLKLMKSKVYTNGAVGLRYQKI